MPSVLDHRGHSVLQKKVLQSATVAAARKATLMQAVHRIQSTMENLFATALKALSRDRK
jgi:hypothetical protein